MAPLTFVRAGELRTAEWAQVDLRNSEWRIPAERMKMDEDLIVPLSHQAMAVIQQLQPQTQAGKYLFASLQGAHRPMSMVPYAGWGDPVAK